jgi:thiamine transport system ATP-binding protein
MLALRDATVRYGDLVAVDRASLEIGADEVVALLGRSGSGKTSILLAIAGVVPMAAGTVTLDGERLDLLPTHRRRIGVVFQDFALFPHLTVGANVRYGVHDLEPAAADARVAEALAMVDLEDLHSRRIDELSGGQAQRVALARTLATRPRALLLDEPLGSLDPALRSEVATGLARLLDELAIPTVLVTHDTSEAFALGDRIAVLDTGRVVACDLPERLWSQPGTAEVARMLGHRGIVAAEISDGAARVADIAIPLGPGVAAGPATLLIRPGAIHLDPAGSLLEVVADRFAGPGWVATVAIGSGTVEVTTEQRRPAGTSIRIGFDPDGIEVLGNQ